MSILKMNIAASIIILVVCLLRLFYLNKLPKITFLLLWSIVIVRLLIPFSVSTKLSIYNIFNNTKYSPLNKTKVDNLYGFLNFDIYNLGSDNPIQSSNILDSLNIWVIIWIIGIVCISIYFIVSYLASIKEFKTSLPVKNEFINIWLDQLKTIRKVNILISDKIISPLTYGFINPIILIPKNIDWNDKLKLRYILEHELCHIKYFDTFYKVILAICLIVNWFNPLVWLMYNLANRDIELICDERVIAKLGEDTKKSYAMALINFEEIKLNSAPFVTNFNKNHIDERIVAIMKFKKMSLLGAILTVSIVGGTATAFATESKQDTITVMRQSSVSIDDNNEASNDQISDLDIKKIDNYEEIVKDMFKTYTVDEYQQVVNNVEKYSDVATSEDLTKFKENLEKLKQDNGKGDFVIYKPAFSKTLELDGGQVEICFNAEYIMDIEEIKSKFTAEQYKSIMNNVLNVMNTAEDEVTEIQKQAVLNKMLSNLELL